MAHVPALETFTTQLGPKEQVLRGGCLSGAILLTDLEFTAGRQFFRMSRCNRTLRMFLTGRSHQSKIGVFDPMAETCLVEFLARLRNQKQEERCTVAIEEEVAEDTVLDALGSDQGSSSTAQAPRATRLDANRKRALLTQFPVVTVDFPFGGEIVQMRIKAVRSKGEAPSFEALPANFRAVFCWFSLEAAQRVDYVSTPKPKALHQPENHPEGRRYFRKDRECFYVKRPKLDTFESLRSTGKTFVVTKRLTKQRLGRPRKRACGASRSQSASFGDESSNALELSSAPPTSEADADQF